MSILGVECDPSLSGPIELDDGKAELEMKTKLDTAPTLKLRPKLEGKCVQCIFDAIATDESLLEGLAASHLLKDAVIKQGQVPSELLLQLKQGPAKHVKNHAYTYRRKIDAVVAERLARAVAVRVVRGVAVEDFDHQPALEKVAEHAHKRKVLLEDWVAPLEVAARHDARVVGLTTRLEPHAHRAPALLPRGRGGAGGVVLPQQRMQRRTVGSRERLDDARLDVLVVLL